MYVGILAAIRAAIKPELQPEIPHFPEYPLNTFNPNPNGTFLVSPNTTQVKLIMDSVTTQLGLQASPAYHMFETANETEAAYLQNPKSVAAGINFEDGSFVSSLQYSIRVAEGSVPSTETKYTGGGKYMYIRLGLMNV